jgi:CelD/BcsL family acetyltransferase involved in cellulose biosynthesis
MDNYSWHCNRHTFAGRLVMAGVDLRAEAEPMGRGTIQMTVRYAHLAPQHNRAAVERLVSAAPAVVAKTASGETGLTTKSVKSRNTNSRTRSRRYDNAIRNNKL